MESIEGDISYPFDISSIKEPVYNKELTILYFKSDEILDVVEITETEYDVFKNNRINEIADEAYNQPPIEPTLEEQLAEKDRQIQLLQAQVQASSDRADFHEDLIAEMAMIVYP